MRRRVVRLILRHAIFVVALYGIVLTAHLGAQQGDAFNTNTKLPPPQPHGDAFSSNSSKGDCLSGRALMLSEIEKWNQENMKAIAAQAQEYQKTFEFDMQLYPDNAKAKQQFKGEFKANMEQNARMRRAQERDYACYKQVYSEMTCPVTEGWYEKLADCQTAAGAEGGKGARVEEPSWETDKDAARPGNPCGTQLGSWPGASDWKRIHAERESKFRQALLNAIKRQAVGGPELVEQVEDYYTKLRLQDCNDEKAEYDRWKMGGVPPPYPVKSEAERIAEEDRRYQREKDRIFHDREVESRTHQENLKRFKGNERMTEIENKRHDRVETRLDSEANSNEERHRRFYESLPEPGS